MLPIGTEIFWGENPPDPSLAARGFGARADAFGIQNSAPTLILGSCQLCLQQAPDSHGTGRFHRFRPGVCTVMWLRDGGTGCARSVMYGVLAPPSGYRKNPGFWLIVDLLMMMSVSYVRQQPIVLINTMSTRHTDDFSSITHYLSSTHPLLKPRADFLYFTYFFRFFSRKH